MTSLRRLLLLTAIILLGACKQPLEIHGGEGDILSQSGMRDCSLEDYLAGLPNCVDNTVENEAYEEVYTARASTSAVGATTARQISTTSVVSRSASTL